MRLVPTSVFRCRAKRLSPQERALLAVALRRLQTDPFDPILHTHKLHGPLSGKWAVSVGHDLRVICLIEQDVVYLLAIGSHGEVY